MCVSDYAALWLRCQIATGETAIALVTAGREWREAAAELGSDVDTIRRAAALYLAHAHRELSVVARDGCPE